MSVRTSEFLTRVVVSSVGGSKFWTSASVGVDGCAVIFDLCKSDVLSVLIISLASVRSSENRTVAGKVLSAGCGVPFVSVGCSVCAVASCESGNVECRVLEVDA